MLHYSPNSQPRYPEYSPLDTNTCNQPQISHLDNTKGLPSVVVEQVSRSLADSDRQFEQCRLPQCGLLNLFTNRPVNI